MYLVDIRAAALPTTLLKSRDWVGYWLVPFNEHNIYIHVGLQTGTIQRAILESGRRKRSNVSLVRLCCAFDF